MAGVIGDLIRRVVDAALKEVLKRTMGTRQSRSRRTSTSGKAGGGLLGDLAEAVLKPARKTRKPTTRRRSPTNRSR